MPALAPVPGVARVVCRGTASGQAIVNIFHFRNGSLPAVTYTATGIVQLATEVATAYAAQFLPRISSGYSGDDVTATDLSSPTGAVGVVTLSGSTGGAGLTVPQSAAACVTWKINRHYRGGHPRTYVGPLGTAAIESPTSLASTYVTALQNAATAFRTSMNSKIIETQTQTLVCVHRQQNGAQLAVPLVDEITAAVVDSRIDSMRRRLGRDR